MVGAKLRADWGARAGKAGKPGTGGVAGRFIGATAFQRSLCNDADARAAHKDSAAPDGSCCVLQRDKRINDEAPPWAPRAAARRRRGAVEGVVGSGMVGLSMRMLRLGAAFVPCARS